MTTKKILLALIMTSIVTAGYSQDSESFTTALGSDSGNMAMQNQSWKQKNKQNQNISAEMLLKYDTNKDGILSDSERIVMRNSMQQQVITQFDTDGDGVLSDTEKQAAQAARQASSVQQGQKKGQGNADRRQQILSQFDTDGDGVMSETERQAAQAARQTSGTKQGKRGGGKRRH